MSIPRTARNTIWDNTAALNHGKCQLAMATDKKLRELYAEGHSVEGAWDFGLKGVS